MEQISFFQMPDFSVGFAQFASLEEGAAWTKSPGCPDQIEVLEEDVAALISRLQDRRTGRMIARVRRCCSAAPRWLGQHVRPDGEPRPC